MRLQAFIFAVLFATTALFGQQTNRLFESIATTDLGCQVKVNDGTYFISSYSDHIVEVRFIPLTGMGAEKSTHAVCVQPQKNGLQLSQKDNSHYELKRADVMIQIQTQPFALAFFYKGEQMLKEGLGYVPGQLHSIDLEITTAEQLMGGGARALGMNRRGYRLQLYNRAHYGYETHSELMNYTMPVFISDKGYMVHFDNPQTGYLDLDAKQNNHVRFETEGGPMTYQIILCDDFKKMTSEWTYLTGRQPMPPRWALGNFASRFGYHSEAEAREVVKTFRNEQIPLDAIIFDLYWFGKTIQGTLGNLSFDPDNFPNPSQMLADFKSAQVKTVLITEPFILTTSKNWAVCDSLKLLGTNALGKTLTYDFYFGHTGLLDIYKPETQVWFWQVYKNLHQMGVSGIWGDLGEPEVHPDEMKHKGAWAHQVHNIYGHDWARLIYDGYKKDFPTERPFILMRAGYAGSQRFGMIPWSGDVNRTWGGLKPQMEISMQMGLQGLAYMHSDLGGFAGANNDPELYVRWLQYGVFQPVFRPHAQEEVPSEAIYKDPATKALAKAAIELRYRLLPYNYTLVYENNTNGWPLMRPIFMEFPNQKWAFDETETYMWGSAFLVHAITDSMASNSLNVYQTKLPSVAEWYDFNTGQRAVPSSLPKTPTGFYTTETAKSLDHIPVFVRAGSFVPMAPIIQSTDAYQDTSVAVHYYHHPQEGVYKGQWYEDDGYSNKAVQHSKYKLLQFTATEQPKQLSIVAQSTFGQRMSSKQFVYRFVIHSENAPKSIKVNGKKVGFTYDEKTKSAIVKDQIRHTENENTHTMVITW